MREGDHILALRKAVDDEIAGLRQALVTEKEEHDVTQRLLADAIADPHGALQGLRRQNAALRQELIKVRATRGDQHLAEDAPRTENGPLPRTWVSPRD